MRARPRPHTRRERLRQRNLAADLGLAAVLAVIITVASGGLAIATLVAALLLLVLGLWTGAQAVLRRARR